MYTYLYCMILSHISLQNYFKKFPKFRKFPIKILFQACRSTGPVDRIYSRPGWSTGQSTEPSVQGVHVLCTSVGRLTGRPTGSSLLSVFGRSTGRSTDNAKWHFSLATGRPTGRPSPTASCQLDCRLTGPVDRQPSTAANGYFSEILYWDSLEILLSAYSEILAAIFWPSNLVLIIFWSPLIPINSGDWSLAKYKKNTYCFQVSIERKSVSRLSIL